MFPFLDLQQAYQNGLLDTSVVPFGVFDDQDRALSILNATTMDLRICGKPYRAVQIGTVATLPEFRGRGLAARLLKHVLQLYEPKTAFQFLFANDSVLDFYPKFGFEHVHQIAHYMVPAGTDNTLLSRIDLEAPDGLPFLRDLLCCRDIISNTMGVLENAKLTELYCRTQYATKLWTDENSEIIVVATVDGATLNVHDIIAKRLPASFFLDLTSEGISRIAVGFTPDRFEGQFETSVPDEDSMFVRRAFPKDIGGFRFPSLAYT